MLGLSFLLLEITNLLEITTEIVRDNKTRVTHANGALKIIHVIPTFDNYQDVHWPIVCKNFLIDISFSYIEAKKEACFLEYLDKFQDAYFIN